MKNSKLEKQTSCQEQYKIAQEKLEQELSKIQKSFPKSELMNNQKIIIQLLQEERRASFRKLIKKLCCWKIKFDEIFFENILQYQQNIEQIIIYLLLIGQGYFSQHSKITKTELINTQIQCGVLQQYFRCQCDNFIIYFEVGIEKHHKIVKQKFEGFQVLHQITFIVLTQDKRFDNVQQSLLDYHKDLKFRLYRQDLNIIECQPTTQIKNNQKQNFVEKQLFQWNQIDQWGECQFNNDPSNQTPVRWLPSEILDQKFTNQDILLWQYYEKYKKWSSPDQIQFLEKRNIITEKVKLNKILLNQYADFESSAKIIEILQKLPDFKIKITKQEKEIIASKQNSLIIGRSGTGKTTCTVLRLFALQILFKLRQKLFSQENEKILWNSDDIQSKIGLHCIFTTQNNVLIGEVRKYYRKLLQYIQASIERNQQKRNQHDCPESLDQSFISSDFSVINDINESSISLILNEDQQINQQEEIQQIKLNDSEEADEIDEIDQFQSLNQITEENFPIFVSIKKLLYLIDSSLKYPFFEQDIFKINGRKLEKAGWNSGKAIKITKKLKTDQTLNVIDLDENAEYEEEDFTMMNKDEIQQKQDETKILLQNQEKNNQQDHLIKEIKIIEIDYDYFLKRFWPTIKHQGQKGSDFESLPTLVWTQIYSCIKGSQYSYQYPKRFLPKSVYKNLNTSSLNDEVINKIYDYFQKYEQWKLSSGAFDQMDLVNYLINEIDKGNLNGTPIHFLFIDEVQDLPYATLTLLTKLTEQGYYFCGDTAQNIVKGVGFRFQDIKQLFRYNENPNLQSLQTQQLTVNFRSHNNILQIANCTVSLIELFFPKSIDRLNKEISNLDGPKPILIDSNDLGDLFSYLTGNIDNKNQGGAIPIEFGCNQVILVKDQDTKDNIPPVLSHALILTIYESKGLEFEDVILFNFFSDSTQNQQWELLNQLFIEEILMDKDQYNSKITKFEQEELNSTNAQDGTNDFNFVNQDGKIVIKKIRLKSSAQTIDLKSFNSLCSELKSLYVAITRAKKRLIIYDEFPGGRVRIQQLWKNLELVEILDQNYYKNIQFSKKVISENTKEEWLQVGIKMFSNKYYDQAIKCFEMASNEKFYLKSQAYSYAQKGEKLYFLSQNQAEISRDQHLPLKIQRESKEKSAKLEKESQTYFIQAGNKFLECEMKKHAAGCFFSAQQYQLSLENYLQIQKWEEAAESAIKLKKFDLAGILYLKVFSLEQSLEAFTQFKNNLIIVNLLQQFQSYLSENLQQLWEHFLPEALKDAFSFYQKQKNQQVDKYTMFIGKEYNFQDLYKNTNVDLHFIGEFEFINSSALKINTSDQFYDCLFNYIFHFRYPILKALDKVFINYPNEQMLDNIQTPIGLRDQDLEIRLIIEVLEYFDCRNIQKFILDYKNQINRDDFYISSVYYISDLYSPIFSLNQLQTGNKQLNTDKESQRLMKDAQKRLIQARDITQEFQITHTNNRQLALYSLCQLGFYKLAIESLKCDIEQQSSQFIWKTRQHHIIYQISEISQIFQDHQTVLQSVLQFQIDYQNFYIIQAKKNICQLSKVLKQFFVKNQKNSRDIFINENFSFPFLDYLYSIFIGQKEVQVQNLDYFFQNEDISELEYKCSLQIIPIMIQNYNTKNLYQQLLELKFKSFQKFIIEIQIIIGLFKQNRMTLIQKQTFDCLQAVFQIQLPTTSMFQYLAQSYIIVNKSSIIFEKLIQNYKQQNYQCFQIDISGQFFMFTSTFVMATIQSIYKDFLTKYVSNYCVKQRNTIPNVPFIVFLYPACVIREFESKNQFNNQIVKQHFFSKKLQDLYQSILPNQFLVDCLQRQLSNDIFNLWYIIPKPTKYDHIQVFDNLATYYFAKAIQDSSKEQMHIHILTAIHALNINQLSDKSFDCINKLIDKRKNDERYFKVNQKALMQQIPFLPEYQLQGYIFYIHYLIQQNVCWSFRNINLYLDFQQRLEDICFAEQIYRDLACCTLNWILCQKSYEHIQNLKAKINELNEELKTSFLCEEYRQSLIEKIIKLENQLASKVIDISLLLPLKISSFINDSKPQKVELDYEKYDDSIIQDLCKQLLKYFDLNNKTMLLIIFFIIGNIQSVRFEIKLALEQELENIKEKKSNQKRDESLEELLNIIDADLKKRQNKIKESKTLGICFEKNVQCQIITIETMQTNVKSLIDYKLTQDQMQNDLEKELRQQTKKKFGSTYVGMRFITYEPLNQSKNAYLTFNDNLLENYNTAEVYNKINNIRIKLIELLYTKSLQKSVNFKSLKQQLCRLAKLEAKLDYAFQKSQIYQYDSVYFFQQKKELKIFKREIENWIQNNNQLASRLEKIEQQLNTDLSQKGAQICVFSNSYKQPKMNKKYRY